MLTEHRQGFQQTLQARHASNHCAANWCKCASFGAPGPKWLCLRSRNFVAESKSVLGVKNEQGRRILLAPQPRKKIAPTLQNNPFKNLTGVAKNEDEHAVPWQTGSRCPRVYMWLGPKTIPKSMGTKETTSHPWQVVASTPWFYLGKWLHMGHHGPG